MDSREKGGAVSIRIFGSLRPYVEARGLPHAFERDAPSEGMTAGLMAEDVGIPPERVEAVFRNGRVINIHDPIYPGDRLAFCPYGTPGPYRVFLGMARENRERARREKKASNGEEQR